MRVESRKVGFFVGPNPSVKTYTFAINEINQLTAKFCIGSEVNIEEIVQLCTDITAGAIHTIIENIVSTHGPFTDLQIQFIKAMEEKKVTAFYSNVNKIIFQKLENFLTKIVSVFNKNPDFNIDVFIDQESKTIFPLLCIIDKNLSKNSDYKKIICEKVCEFIVEKIKNMVINRISAALHKTFEEMQQVCNRLEEETELLYCALALLKYSDSAAKKAAHRSLIDYHVKIFINENLEEITEEIIRRYCSDRNTNWDDISPLLTTASQHIKPLLRFDVRTHLNTDVQLNQKIFKVVKDKIQEIIEKKIQCFIETTNIEESKRGCVTSVEMLALCDSAKKEIPDLLGILKVLNPTSYTDDEIEKQKNTARKQIDENLKIFLLFQCIQCIKEKPPTTLNNIRTIVFFNPGSRYQGKTGYFLHVYTICDDYVYRQKSKESYYDRITPTLDHAIDSYLINRAYASVDSASTSFIRIVKAANNIKENPNINSQAYQLLITEYQTLEAEERDKIESIQEEQHKSIVSLPEQSTAQSSVVGLSLGCH